MKIDFVKLELGVTALFALIYWYLTFTNVQLLGYIVSIVATVTLIAKVNAYRKMKDQMNQLSAEMLYRVFKDKK